MESIIAAVIAGVLAAGASIYASRAANDKLVAVLSERLDRYKESTDEKIDELSQHVERHNNLIERMTVQEMHTQSQWKRIDELKEDVDELKKGA